VDGGESSLVGALVNWRLVVVLLGESFRRCLHCAENGALGSLGAWSSSLGRR
jgi:hypothetical protein